MQDSPGYKKDIIELHTILKSLDVKVEHVLNPTKEVCSDNITWITAGNTCRDIHFTGKDISFRALPLEKYPCPVTRISLDVHLNTALIYQY